MGGRMAVLSLTEGSEAMFPEFWACLRDSECEAGQAVIGPHPEVDRLLLDPGHPPARLSAVMAERFMDLFGEVPGWGSLGGDPIPVSFSPVDEDD